MNDKTDKNYAPKVWIREKVFQATGNSILNVTIGDVAGFCDWLRGIADEKGGARLGISARREKVEGKPTHTMWQDTWKPSGCGARQPSAPRPPEPDPFAGMVAKVREVPAETTDDLPF